MPSEKRLEHAEPSEISRAWPAPWLDPRFGVPHNTPRNHPLSTSAPSIDKAVLVSTSPMLLSIPTRLTHRRDSVPAGQDSARKHCFRNSIDMHASRRIVL